MPIMPIMPTIPQQLPEITIEPAINIEIINDEQDLQNIIFDNLVIDNTIFTNEILPHLTDSVSFEFIVDPVFFPNVDETIYSRATINHLLDNERRIRDAQLMSYDEEARVIISSRLRNVPLEIKSPVTRKRLYENMLRSARLFMDVILISINYANNIDVNSIVDENFKNSLIGAIDDLMSNYNVDRRHSAEETLISISQRDLRNLNSGLTNYQLELLTDWCIITTSPRIPSEPRPRVRPREDNRDSEDQPRIRRSFQELLSIGLSSFSQSGIPLPPPLLFQFPSISNLAPSVQPRIQLNRAPLSDIVDMQRQRQDAIENIVLARNLGA